MRVASKITVIAATFAFAFAGCLTGGSDDGISIEDEDVGESEGDVTLIDNYFEPDSARASVPFELVFTNRGDEWHTVTIHLDGTPDGERALDERLEPGDAVPFRFEEPGTYQVWCRYHGNMTGGGMSMIVEATE